MCHASPVHECIVAHESCLQLKQKLNQNIFGLLTLVVCPSLRCLCLSLQSLVRRSGRFCVNGRLQYSAGATASSRDKLPRAEHFPHKVSILCSTKDVLYGSDSYDACVVRVPATLHSATAKGRRKSRQTISEVVMFECCQLLNMARTNPFLC